MPTYLTRPDREIKEVSGVGGLLRFGHPDYRTDVILDEPASNWAILDVTAWRLRERLTLPDITHSGSFGAIKRAMTSRDWEASIALAWNSAARVSGQPFSGFLQDLLIGNQAAGFNVAVILHLGDPVAGYIDNLGNQRDSSKLFAPLALCGNIEMINDATGKDVVRATAVLQGNSRLQGWTGLGYLRTNRPGFTL